MTEDKQSFSTNKNMLVIERIFDAPVEEVWKYFSDPELYKKWWGPKDFTRPAPMSILKMPAKQSGS